MSFLQLCSNIYITLINWKCCSFKYTFVYVFVIVSKSPSIWETNAIITLSSNKYQYIVLKWNDRNMIAIYIYYIKYEQLKHMHFGFNLTITDCSSNVYVKIKSIVPDPYPTINLQIYIETNFNYILQIFCLFSLCICLIWITLASVPINLQNRKPKCIRF